MFLYIMNYLSGFTEWTLDQLKGYGNSKLDGYRTMAHGHPEIQESGVEMTTGPLGQGIANSVGMAIAAKNLGAKFNKPDLDIMTSRVYCMTGDGCLMEGVALEGM
jgi:dihydroxyacetone synthase